MLLQKRRMKTGFRSDCVTQHFTKGGAIISVSSKSASDFRFIRETYAPGLSRYRFSENFTPRVFQAPSGKLINFYSQVK